MDQYIKIKAVGRGAHGMAYLCRRKTDNAPVVIKQLLTTTMSDAEKQSSMNEINVLTMLRHPNIVAYFDSLTVQMTTPDQDPFASSEVNSQPSGSPAGGTSQALSPQAQQLAPLSNQLQIPRAGELSPIRKVPSATGIDAGLSRTPSKKLLERRPSIVKPNPKIPSTLMIVMEYADGGTLSDFLESCKQPLEEPMVLRMMCQITMAVLHIHSLNILHRDLKTNNIFIAGSGSSMVLKIGDFGISKMVTSTVDADTIVGTPAYLSPELCEGKGYNQKSDIWALGCVFYEIATLKKMFAGHNLPALVLKILKGKYEPLPSAFSKDLSNLIASCVDLDPNLRPLTIDILSKPFIQDVLVDVMFSAGRCWS